jgi:hypothetical protein
MAVATRSEAPATASAPGSGAELHEAARAARDREDPGPEVGNEMEHAGGHAPCARMLDAHHLEREPGAERDEDVAGDGCQQVALDLRVDLVEDANGILLGRERRAHRLDELAPKCSPAASRK